MTGCFEVIRPDHKRLRKAQEEFLHDSFDRPSIRVWSEIYQWALWNCWFIAIRDFSF